MEYPLHFKYRDVIVGNGFTAGVAVSGRVLMTVDEEDNGVWFYGAVPGAIAAFGETPTDAHAEFRELYREILRDFAQDSVDFSDFRERVSAFARTGTEATMAAWESALEAVRRDGTVIEGLPKKAAPDPTVEVALLEGAKLPAVRFAACDSELVEKALAA